MNLYLDIETLPTDRDDVREYIAATVSPPGNISKAETIAKWNEEQRPAAVEEAVAKTGLDGSFGRVCVIGWAIDNGPVKTIYSANDERQLLTEFARALKDEVAPSELFDTCVIGHNVCAFDLRFLTQRFIVNGIKPPLSIDRAARAKPWEDAKVFDTMVQWAGVGNRISLEKLCLALGIPNPKTDITGATVAAAVAAGRIADVAAYCAGDVEATRAAHLRMTFAAEAA
jgi:hypothetical protein